MGWKSYRSLTRVVSFGLICLITSLPVGGWFVDSGDEESLLIASHSANVLFTLRDGNLYRSENYGKNWHRVDIGRESLISLFTYECMAIPSLLSISPRTCFYAIAQSGAVLESSYDGKNWQHVTVSDAAPFTPLVQWILHRPNQLPRPHFIVPDPVVPTVLYGVSWGGQMWRSLDSGNHWERIQFNGGREKVGSIAVTRGGLEGAAVRFGCSCGGAAVGNTTSIVYVLGSEMLYVSYDQGDSWSVRVTLGLDAADLTALSVDPVNPQVLYGLLRSSAGIARTLDGGHTWHLLRAP